MSRQEPEIRAGIGAQQGKVRYEKAEDEPTPWSLDTAFRLVGQDHVRLDGVAKVSGRARYPSDERPADLCFAAILRSPIAAGKVVSIDVGPAKEMQGVLAVQPIAKAGATIRYQGQELVACAATSKVLAREALARVRLELERTEHEVDPQEGLREGLANSADPLPTSLDEVGKSGTDEVELKLLFETQTQMHHPLEPHGITAWYREGDGGPSLEVWASTQGTFGMRQALEQIEGLRGRVTVHTEYMGGGFGAKLTPGVEARACAELSKEIGRPVHLFVDRRACALATGNRPASLQLLTARAKADGTLTGWESMTRGFPGYTGSGGVRGSQGFYVRMRDRGDHKDMRANTGSARAFRAPGCPQGYFASEGLIDEMAYRVGMDPLAFRLHNLQNEIHKEQLGIAAEAIGYRQGRNAAPGRAEAGQTRLRGIGMAISSWFQAGRSNNAVLCRIHPDGRVEVRNGAQDIGTGTRTVLGLVAAEELGQPIDRVEVVLGHTTDPAGPGSGGSTTTPSLAPTVRKAAFLAGRELCRAVAESLGKTAGEVRLDGGRIVVGGDTVLSFAEACKHLRQTPVEALARGWKSWRGFTGGVHGAQMADLSVDLRTGAIELHRIVAVQDCGTVIDKLTAESQVIGGVIQGIGFAMYEERLTDPALGRVLNTDFEQYRIPGVMEMPEIVAILPAANNGHNCAGTMGLGEPPTIPTSAAIANAVRNATGVRPLRLPLTPARIHEGLARMKIGRKA